MFKLLTRTNPKTLKGEKKGYQTFILHLAPHKLSGWNVCAGASKECIKLCLNTSGHGGIGAGTLHQIATGRKTNVVQLARIRRTRRFFEDRAGFMRDLVSDIRKAIKFAQARGYTPVFRLNGTSDIRWETVKHEGSTIFGLFPNIQFYDYTKLANRRGLPSNYHLTFSLAEDNETQAFEWVWPAGLNLAVVFRDKATVQRYIKTSFRGLPVCDGDESDLRFLDPPGHIVALYAKGRAKKDKSGFVRD